MRRLQLIFGLLVLLAATPAMWSCSGAAPQTDRGGTDRSGASRAAVDQFDERLGSLLERRATRRARTASVEAMLQSGATDRAEAIRHERLVRWVYRRRDFQPVWYAGPADGVRLSEAGRHLAGRLRESVERHGLWPEQVHLRAVEEARREAREICCEASLDRLRLRPEERAALVGVLADSDAIEESASDEEIAGTILDVVTRPDGPTPRLAGAVTERVEALERRSGAAAAAEVYLTDALAEYILAMKWSNPAWHDAFAWHATFRLGERGPLRAGHKPGDKEGSATRRIARAVDSARAAAFAAEALKQSAQTPERTADLLDSVVPRFEQYRRLVEAFRRYRPLVERGGWPELPGSAVGLKPGHVSPVVATLKERLRLEGFYNEPPAEEPSQANRFDEALKTAVLEYQRTHQLWDHGYVTEQTLRSLNVPAEQRWRQLRVTLQRWRDSRIGPDTHYVHVNIPDFHAEVWRDGQRKMRFRVVTGDAKREEDKETKEVRFPHQTPRFSDRIEYMVMNPYWKVPESIRKNELKPKLKENPDYYEENGFEVVVADNGYEFVQQKPGPENALGRVKFLFPNEHSVYLHDTPAKSLFDRPTRAASHGCVRIQDPMDFANYLLDLDGRWSGEDRKEKFKQWFEKDSETWVTLQQEVPIHIEYYVVRVDGQGRANFLADPYDLDVPRLEGVAERLRGYPDGYDLPRTDADALMRRALAGHLEERPTPASPWTDPASATYSPPGGKGDWVEPPPFDDPEKDAGANNPGQDGQREQGENEAGESEAGEGEVGDGQADEGQTDEGQTEG